MRSRWEFSTRASNEALIYLWESQYMTDTYAGFLDAGFLRAEGAKVLKSKPNDVRLNASFIVEWFHQLRTNGEVPYFSGSNLLRVYWYDGAYDPTHAKFESQRPYHDAIAYTPGVQLRLGQVVERPTKWKKPIYNALENTAKGLGLEPNRLIHEFEKNWKFYPTAQQKGVDTLIALDMVRLASRSAFGTAILISGDRDLAEVVRTVQDYGITVIIATPNRKSVAAEVLQIADGIVEIDSRDVRRMLLDRPSEN